jgi:hypothetical protein
MNVEIEKEAPAIPRKGIHKWDFHYSVMEKERKAWLNSPVQHLNNRGHEQNLSSTPAEI